MPHWSELGVNKAQVDLEYTSTYMLDGGCVEILEPEVYRPETDCALVLALRDGLKMDSLMGIYIY